MILLRQHLLSVLEETHFVDSSLHVMTDLKRKTELTRICGYEVLGKLELSQGIWWNEYYAPLKIQLKECQGIDSWSERDKHEMRLAEQEIKAFKYDDDRFASVFFVLKKQN